jgi:hypothetical protein
MKLASLAFVAVLLIAHLGGDPAENLALPLSMFRDGEYANFGYALFALLLVIAALMLRRLHRAGRDVDAVLLGVVSVFLVLVAITPSLDGFHGLFSFVLIGLLYAYYAAVLHREGPIWMWLHLALPVLLLAATRFHSYGLWQKSIIVYFVLVVNLQHWLVTRGRAALDLPRPGRTGGQRRKRVIHVIEADRSWSRKSS